MKRVAGQVCLFALTGALLLSVDVWGDTFEVESASSGGAGSLRAAIMAVNAETSGNHQIIFADSYMTVNLTSALPALTYAGGTVTISGSGAILNGSGLSGSEVGLHFQGGPVFLEDMDIVYFPSHGIQIEADGSAVAQCKIGSRGSTDMGNGGNGIHVNGAVDITIGGAKGGNVISGNDLSGIYVIGSEDVTITRNKIGLNDVGRAPLGNGQSGIQIVASELCRVGSSSTADRNYIAANGADGVLINASNDCSVKGNYIGIDTLQAAQPNGGAGVQVAVGQDNQIGGTVADEGNVISGNTGSGIVVSEPASETRVFGNRIGTNEAGTSAIPNGFAGVHLAGGFLNEIGGGEEGAGNTISGNAQAGVLVQSITTANSIEGNYIGTDANGQSAIPNLYGVFFDRASSNTLGGTEPGEGNVISGNTSSGVRMDGTETEACSLNFVLGNRVGLRADGAAAIPNGAEGILLQNAASNFIGGSELGSGNIISGNTTNGISMTGEFVGENVVAGNWIGLDGGGAAAVPNGGDGVLVRGADNEIGGMDAGAGNIISGNTGCGVRVDGVESSGTIVKGNWVGVNVEGTATVPNEAAGVLVQSSSDNVIGGAESGAANYISGNTGGGVEISGDVTPVTNNIIQGNIIGLLPNP